MKPSGQSIVLIAFIVALLVFQAGTGIWGSDFGSYGDESLHYVTGLMIRDFLVSGDWLHPMPFAIDYYLHFPKIGLGNWPPLFPLLEAIWMLLAGHSRPSMLVFLALLAAALATLIYRSTPGPWPLRILACLVVLFSPATQFQTATVMAELALALFTWLAVLAFLGLLERPTAQNALIWAFWTLAAIFTKGNAWVLAPVFGISLSATGCWRLLGNRSLWLGAALISIFSVPYTLWTMRVVTQGWDTRSIPDAGYYALSLWRHTLLGIDILGWPLSALAVVGFVVRCVLPWTRGGKPEAFWTTAGIFAVMVIVFHTLVPTSIEQRKVFQLFPACTLFLAAGLEWCSRRIPVPAVAAIAVALWFAGGFHLLPVYRPGVADVVRFVQARPDSRGAAILVSSSPFMNDCEGGLIAAWAERDRLGGTYMVRATKLLLGPPQATRATDFELPLRYATKGALATALEQVPIRYAIVHSAPAPRKYLHHDLLAAALSSPASDWRLLATFGPEGNFPDTFRVYEAPARPAAPGTPKVNIDMRHRLGIQMGTNP